MVVNQIIEVNDELNETMIANMDTIGNHLLTLNETVEANFDSIAHDINELAVKHQLDIGIVLVPFLIFATQVIKWGDENNFHSLPFFQMSFNFILICL